MWSFFGDENNKEMPLHRNKVHMWGRVHTEYKLMSDIKNSLTP